MRYILFFVIGLLTMAANAEQTSISILNIEHPEEISEGVVVDDLDKITVYGSDGVVYEVDSRNISLVNQLEYAQAEQLEVDITLSDHTELTDELAIRDEILGVNLSNTKSYSALSTHKAFPGKIKSLGNQDQLLNEEITDFESDEDAFKFFKTQRTDTKRRSQCYNRAHVWSWELLKRTYKGEKIKTGKIWIFWSKRYTRKYRFKWWFHISPYVTVNGKTTVMDRTFMKTPVDPDTWVDNLTKYKTTCKEVYAYSGYRDNQDSEDCFFIKSSYYYWQPFQIENLEKKGEARVEWKDWEIVRAYKNAISRWIRKVP